MIQRFIRWPWGRAACVVGGLGSFLALEGGTASAAPALAVFVFAGVALHGIAVWRDKS